MTRKFRIIQVVNVRWFNATAWYAVFLSRLLKEAGHEVLVIGLDHTDSLAKAREWGLETQTLPLNSAKPWNMVRVFFALRRLVREYKPDIINCHRGEAFALCCLVKFLVGGFALVRTRGDQRLPRNNFFNRLLHTRAADALIASNSSIARIFLRSFKANPSRVFIIPGGVDTRAFYPDRSAGRTVRAALGYGPEDFVVGLLGRLDPVKGHAVLIRALGQIQKRYPDAFNIRLLCLGAPVNLSEQDILRICDQAGLAGHVQVTGLVADVRAHINALDLGVVASISSEAVVRAALEILACDVPLISSDVGVMPDILPLAGLVPYGDVPALSEAVERCWRNREALESLRRAGREALNSGLRAEYFLEQTLGVYASVTGCGA